MKSWIENIDKPIKYALGFIVLVLIVGNIYTLINLGTMPFFSPNYLLQQLQVASFLGLIATGMMVVILLGHIDLSVPWTLTCAAMTATAVGGDGAMLAGLTAGLIIGLINGIGVAFLRVPSMIFTLGVNTVVQGLMIVHTGGYAPQTASTPIMNFLATGYIAGIPTALFVWAAIGGLIIFMLNRTPMGRYLYAMGNREVAAYLSGVNTRLILIAAFVICSLCAAMAGILLAGYSAKAYQGMGDLYLLPAIAAVVIGGTNILGGKGTLAGTVVGAILIVLLQSVLSVMQMPEAGRQIIYGSVIIGMLLVYGRAEKKES
ncbi:MAG: ABC transporter permease [Alphaproteobacteria bacterium]|nr:ABC transporter permease [Alphaproteobacteria bacterium]